MLKPVIGAYSGKATYSVTLIDQQSGIVNGEWASLNGFYPVSIEIVGASSGAVVQLWASNYPTEPAYDGVQINENYTTDLIVAMPVPVRWIKAKVVQAGSSPVSVHLFGSH